MKLHPFKINWYYNLNRVIGFLCNIIKSFIFIYNGFLRFFVQYSNFRNFCESWKVVFAISLFVCYHFVLRFSSRDIFYVIGTKHFFIKIFTFCYICPIQF